MPFLSEFFYALFLGLFSQNLALEMGIGTGRLFSLSGERGNLRRRAFFWIMLAVTMTATLVTYFADMAIGVLFTETAAKEVTRGFVFVAVMALLELVLELVLGRFFADFREALGHYLPGACLNSAVLAVLLLNRRAENGLVSSLLFAFFAVLGYILSVLLMQALRERVALVRCPPSMKGEPLAFLAATMLSLAFAGLTDMNFPY